MSTRVLDYVYNSSCFQILSNPMKIISEINSKQHKISIKLKQVDQNRQGSNCRNMLTGLIPKTGKKKHTDSIHIKMWNCYPF